MANTPMQGVMPQDVDVQAVQAARHCSARQRLKKGGKGGDPGVVAGGHRLCRLLHLWLAGMDRSG